MEMRLIHVRDIWANVPFRWAKQYERGADKEQREITKKLAALAPDELTGERIEAIMNGNTSWTRQRCDNCDLEKDTLCRIGQTPDYDTRWVDVCCDCLVNAVILFDKSA